MRQAPSRMLFVNTSVRDLSKSMAFFRTLGFDFNPKFTDENAACMVLSDKGFVMLLAEPFFRTFTDREVCDREARTECLIGLSCASRAEVDAMMQTALDGGARDVGKVQDLGFMYGRAFYDLDGHHWELFWMDPAAAA